MWLVIEQPQARETTIIKAISIIIGATIIKENKIIKANTIKEIIFWIIDKILFYIPINSIINGGTNNG